MAAFRKRRRFPVAGPLPRGGRSRGASGSCLFISPAGAADVFLIPAPAGSRISYLFRDGPDPGEQFRIPIRKPLFFAFPRAGDSFSRETPRELSCTVAPAGGSPVKRRLYRPFPEKLSRFFPILSHFGRCAPSSGPSTGPYWPPAGSSGTLLPVHGNRH